MKNMIKKTLAALLALVLLAGALPAAFAQSYDDMWLLYCADADQRHFTAVFVAPAKYTRLSGEPRVQTVYTGAQPETRVLTPEAEQILFYFDGKTETRWTLTVTGELPEGSVPGYDFKYAVLPGSVLDEAGNGNAQFFFEDGVDYLEARGYTEIDVYSKLLQRDYAREDGTVAVGDTLRAEYSGLYPTDIYVNGAKAASFPGGEMQRFACSVTETGMLDVRVKQGGREIASRTLAVISSEEMYERNLREGLITGEDIPTTQDLIDVGVPAGSPFILVAKIVAFFVGVRDFFQRLFSFTRISR